MIDQILRNAVVEINKLDPKLPTIIKIDLSKDLMVGTQDCSNIVYFNNLLTLASTKTKGKYYLVLHPQDLIDIRDSLLYCMNHTKEVSIIITKDGFSVGRFREYINPSGIISHKFSIFRHLPIIRRVFWSKVLLIWSKSLNNIYKYLKRVE